MQLNASMDEPLLSYMSPRRRASISGHGESLLFSLPEDEQATMPLSLPSPSALRSAGAWKERLIFGNVPSSDGGASDSLKDAVSGFRTGVNEEVPEEVCDNDKPAGQVSFLTPNDSFVLNVAADDSNKYLQPIDQLWGSHLEGRRKNLHRSRTAPAMSAMCNVREGLKRPELDSVSSIVRQAILGLLIYLSFGMGVYWFNRDHFAGNETNSIIDAFYFCIVTMCTIGYGDITPTSTIAKLFSCLFVLVGFGFIDILLSGMVTYVLDKQENFLLQAVDGSHHDIAKTYFVDVKKGRMRIRMKVAIALGVVVLCIGVGAGVMHSVERLGWIDSFYLSVMSVTTVGYGDRAFRTLRGRLFAAIWLLVSTLAVARAFLYLAEARIDKRHRLIAKWVLQRDMTVQDLMAADIDNNGFVSKSEFVIYKLKEMGKVEEKDIVAIVKQFNRLDTDNCGKITLSLLSGH